VCFTITGTAGFGFCIFEQLKPVVFGNICQKARGVASKPAPDASGGVVIFMFSQRGICALVAKIKSSVLEEH